MNEMSHVDKMRELLVLYDGGDGADDPWELIQAMSWVLDHMIEDLAGGTQDGPERLYPTKEDIPTVELAEKAAEYAKEIVLRYEADRCDKLELAKSLWPSLKEILEVKGLSLDHRSMWDGPRMATWSEEPVLSFDGMGYLRKPRTKGEAVERIWKHGDGKHGTFSEIFLWAHGGGPVWDRALDNYGYAPLKKGKK